MEKTQHLNDLALPGKKNFRFAPPPPGREVSRRGKTGFEAGKNWVDTARG